MNSKKIHRPLFFLLLAKAFLLAKPVHAEEADQAAIRKGIKGSLPEVHKCYDTYLKEKKDGAKSGKIEMKWVIGDDGVPHSFGQKTDDIKNPTLNNCIAFALSSAKFPKPPKGQDAVITYPFVFNKNK